MICIVSPHLDDAALSCADHALQWTSTGESPLVVNVFSAAGAVGADSELMAPSLRAAGTADAAAYMALRKAEDLACLRALGLRRLDLDFVDAGFRGTDAPAFPTLASLRPARLSRQDLDLVAAVADALRAHANARLALSPLGVGGHVDHLIARAACERVFPADRLAYYADMPYARAPWKWSLAALGRLARARWSLRAMSERKRAALGHYRSQMPLLFRGPPRYPEVILLPWGFEP